MNALKRFRRLRSVEDTPAPTSHAANLEVVHELAAEYAPAVGSLGGSLQWLDALQEPEAEPEPLADPDDPTPIFDAVMGGGDLDLATQFEVAFILDELDDDERHQERLEAVRSAEFGATT